MFFNLLDVESEDVVKFIGISGLSGIGKTTIAQAVYKKICHKFDRRFFLEDVRGASEKTKDLIDLQKQLLSEPKIISNVYEGKRFIQRCLCMKKVLIVLDNVDRIAQLQALAGSSDWFGGGSRIIITTSNVQVLEGYTATIYEVEELDSHQSRQLFYKHAFRKDHPSDDILQLAEDVASIAGGLPLALVVLGDFLFNEKRPQIWKSTLETLRKIPHKDIEARLRISYDDLDDFDKDIFLDIACFFNGTDKEYATYIWEECNFSPDSKIQNLIKRSLVKIIVCNGQDEIRMHDQLRDMGRHIVRQESSFQPGKRSRLWSQEDVLNVLKRREGTSSVQGIALKFEEETASASGVDCFSTEEFEAMSKLRLLQIDNVHLWGDFSKLTLELKWLSWKGCPLESIPIDFCLEKLAVLDLSCSRIKQVWNGGHQNKQLKGLKILNLNGCKLLTETPDFSRLPNLHKIDLEGCIELRELSPSICNLNSLKNLCVSGCSNLCGLPDSISKMRNLTTFSLDGTRISKLPDGVGLLEKIEILSVRYCWNLVKLPDSMGKMRLLRDFSIDGTGVDKLPEDFGMLSSLRELSMSYCREFKGFPENFSRLLNLEKLNLEGCIEFRELPHNLCDLRSLKKLILSDCSNLNKLSDCKLVRTSLDWIGNMRYLKELSLDGTSMTELPNEVGLLEKMEELSVKRCSNLVKLPDSMGKMRHLRRFHISESCVGELPEDFGMLSRLRDLYIRNCQELKGFPKNFGSLTRLRTLDVSGNSKLFMLPNSFSGLSSLQLLHASRCNLSEDGIPTDIGKLSELRNLDLSHNNFCSLPASIVTLSRLWSLDLRNCRNLQSLPRLSSVLVNVQNCVLLESIPHISDLKGVQELNLSNCERLAQIQGIDEHMEREGYLPRLLVSGCSRALVNSVKKSIGQQVELLRNLPIYSFGFDGSKVPDCFTPLKISSPCTVEKKVGLGKEWEMGPITFTDNIICLFLCFVLTNPSVEAQVRYSYDIIDPNGEKHSQEIIPFFQVSPSKTHQHQIVISGKFTHECVFYGKDLHWLLKKASQMLLRIYIKERYKMEVKECGVHLIYKETEESDYKRLAYAISQETTSRKRTMSQLLYQDSNNHVHGAEASTSRSKRTKLKHDNDDDNMEEVLVSLQNMELD